MAKDDITAANISTVEDQLRDSLDNLRKIRRFMEDHKAETIPLDFGTVQFYAQWIDNWSIRNVGMAEAYLKTSERVRQTVKVARERVKAKRKAKKSS